MLAPSYSSFSPNERKSPKEIIASAVSSVNVRLNEGD
jgi:hypothetical protein